MTLHFLLYVYILLLFQNWSMYRMQIGQSNAKLSGKLNASIGKLPNNNCNDKEVQLNTHSMSN